MHVVVLGPFFLITISQTYCIKLQLWWKKWVGHFGNSPDFCVEPERKESEGRALRKRGAVPTEEEWNKWIWNAIWWYEVFQWWLRTWSFSMCRASLPKGWLGALAFNTVLSSCTTQQQFKWELNPSQQLLFIPQLITCSVTVCLLKFPPKRSCFQPFQENKDTRELKAEKQTALKVPILNILERQENYENGPQAEKWRADIVVIWCKIGWNCKFRNKQGKVWEVMILQLAVINNSTVCFSFCSIDQRETLTVLLPDSCNSDLVSRFMASNISAI